MSAIDDEARRLRLEAARQAELRRTAKEEAERRQYSEKQERIREQTQERLRAEARIKEAAEPAIRDAKLRELLAEVRDKLWKCGTIQERVVNGQVRLALEYGPYQGIQPYPDGVMEADFTDVVGFEVRPHSEGIEVCKIGGGGGCANIDSEKDYSGLRSAAIKWLAQSWNERRQTTPRQSAKDAWKEVKNVRKGRPWR